MLGGGSLWQGHTVYHLILRSSPFFDTQVTREWRGVKTNTKNCGHRVEDQGKIGEQLEGQFRKDFFLLSPPFIWRIKEFFSSTTDLTHIHIAPSPVNS